MSQACGALEHAHSRSIVHRDIKPSNIMLVNKDGDADYVKVVDFGIAQLVTEDNTLQKLTQTGQIFGTPLYMSPEQCQGHKLDARTDIYSLGCVMYEAITGKVPIEGANVYETIFKQINTLPEGIGAAVSERQLRMDLESIMFTAMAKEPGNRYSSMHHFQNEIDAVLTGQKKRNFFSGFINLRLILHHLRPGLSPMNSIMSLVLLAGVAMIAFTTFQGGQQSGANAQERWKKLDLSGQESFDNGELSKSRQQFTDSLKIAKEMQDRKLVLASLNEIADLNRVSKEDDKKISAEIEQYSNPDAPVLALQSQIRAEQDKLNAGAKPDQAALIQLRKFCDDAIDAAMSVSDDGDRKTAKAMLVPIKEIVEKTFGENDQLMFRCLHNLALVAHNTGDYSGAIEGYKQALALGDKVLSAGDPKLARTCRALGRAYIQTGRDYPEAEKLLERALEINRNSFGPESAQVAVCRYLLASLYFDEGRNAEAKREIASAVSIYDHAREADNRELASAYLMYGRVYNDVSYYKKALKVFEEMPAKDYPSMCQDLLRLADSAIELNPAQAENYLLRAQAMCDRFYPLDREMTLTNIYQTRAAIYKKEGKMQQSVESLKKALETAEKVFGQGSFKVIFILHEVAPALAATGANSEAESAYKQAFNLLKQNPNAQKTIGTAIFLDYVRFLNKLERKDDAKKLAEEWRQVLTVSR
jgi:tetratricopeptide (TPR) repeat protein